MESSNTVVCSLPNIGCIRIHTLHTAYYSGENKYFTPTWIRKFTYLDITTVNIFYYIVTVRHNIKEKNLSMTLFGFFMNLFVFKTVKKVFHPLPNIEYSVSQRAVGLLSRCTLTLYSILVLNLPSST